MQLDFRQHEPESRILGQHSSDQSLQLIAYADTEINSLPIQRGLKLVKLLKLCSLVWKDDDFILDFLVESNNVWVPKGDLTKHKGV